MELVTVKELYGKREEYIGKTISVGGWGTLYECSQCGSNDIAVVHDPVNDNVYCTCRKCGHDWIAVEIH